MKRLKPVMAFVMAILLLTGCDTKTQRNDYVRLYYINKEGTDLVKVSDQRFPKDRYDLEKAVSAIRGKAPDHDLKPMLIDDVRMLSMTVKNGTAEVNLSKEINSVSFSRRLLMEAAVVNALMITGDVENVRFLVEGKPELVDGKEKNYTMADFLVLNDSDVVENQRADIIFYFLDKKKSKLIRSIRTVTYNKDKLEINTVQSLLRGPLMTEEEMNSPFPKSLEVREAKTVDGICHVKLNDGLEEIKGERPLKLAVYSIVNTVSSIPGIKGVMIYSDNNPGVMYKGQRLYTQTLEKNENESIVIVPKN